MRHNYPLITIATIAMCGIASVVGCVKTPGTDSDAAGQTNIVRSKNVCDDIPKQLRRKSSTGYSGSLSEPQNKKYKTADLIRTHTVEYKSSGLPMTERSYSRENRDLQTERIDYTYDGGCHLVREKHYNAPGEETDDRYKTKEDSYTYPDAEGRLTKLVSAVFGQIAGNYSLDLDYITAGTGTNTISRVSKVVSKSSFNDVVIEIELDWDKFTLTRTEGELARLKDDFLPTRIEGGSTSDDSVVLRRAVYTFRDAVALEHADVISGAEYLNLLPVVNLEATMDVYVNKKVTETSLTRKVSQTCEGSGRNLSCSGTEETPLKTTAIKQMFQMPDEHSPCAKRGWVANSVKRFDATDGVGFVISEKSDDYTCPLTTQEQQVDSDKDNAKVIQAVDFAYTYNTDDKDKRRPEKIETFYSDTKVSVLNIEYQD